MSTDSKIKELSFKISDPEELAKLQEWKEAIKKIYGEYGLYEYRFSPNGIGSGIKVYSYLAKTTIDITNLSNW